MPPLPPHRQGTPSSMAFDVKTQLHEVTISTGVQSTSAKATISSIVASFRLVVTGRFFFKKVINIPSKSNKPNKQSVLFLLYISVLPYVQVVFCGGSEAKRGFPDHTTATLQDVTSLAPKIHRHASFQLLAEFPMRLWKTLMAETGSSNWKQWSQKDAPHGDRGGLRQL